VPVSPEILLIVTLGSGSKSLLSGLVSSGAAGFLCENKRDNYLLCWRLPIMLYFYFAFILM
jgi:hypothetical protein